MTKYLFHILSMLLVLNCSQKIDLTFAGGFKGGTYFLIGESLSILKDFNVKEISTDGSLDNLYHLSDKKADFSISQMDVVQNLSIGDRETLSKIKVLFPIYGEEVHIIANKTVTQIKDLKGKKISIGDSESGSKYTSLIFLDQMGINGETTTLEEIGSSKSLEMLLDGKLDAMVLVAGAPVKMLAELPNEKSDKIHLLSFPEENLQVVRGTNLTYQRSEIGASTYSWEIKPISTIVVQSVMIVRSDIEEKKIKKFIKTVFKNKELLSTKHEKWKNLSKENLEKHFNKNPDVFHPIIKDLLGEI